MASAGATPAISALEAAGRPYELRSYPHDAGVPSFGAEAVAALGVEPERVLKTLIADAGGELVVAVLPVPERLDPKALGAALGTKRVTLADPAAAERATGYVVGAISPLGQRRRLRTVVDESALSWPTVLCSAGRRGLEVELAPDDLVAMRDRARQLPSSHRPRRWERCDALPLTTAGKVDRRALVAALAADAGAGDG